MPTASIITDRRGTAFAEALVTIPFFAAALVGVVALHSIYGAKLEAKSRARRLAWLQSDSGECPAQTCKEQCLQAEAAIRADGLERALSTGARGFELRGFLRDAGEHLVGRVTHGVGQAHAPMPNGIGGGRTRQRGVTTLLCNTRRRASNDGDNVLAHACSSGLRELDYASEVCD
jgi:hypothetical protein